LQRDDEFRKRLPVKLLNEYDAAWDRYTTCCRTGASKPERAAAYALARKQEDLLTTAVEVTREERRREKARNTAAKRD
jgi:hypothetical protein